MRGTVAQPQGCDIQLMRTQVMFRREAVQYAAAAVIPIGYRAPELVPDDDAGEDPAEHARVEALAQKLADLEFYAIQEAHDNWPAVSYLADIKLAEEYAAFYIVTRDTKLLDRWSMRVERAMFPGKLRVYALGKAGYIEGRDDGYFNVTLFIVGREGLEQERRAFADLYGNYPDPQSMR